ncbi:MAG: metallophosphoesterase [Candidatus Pacearchaeota archaeon]|nr:metallophosphoesterase [Candidatus Pacearchaeota archaeon]
MKNTPEILRFCLEKGFLLDNEVLNMLNDSDVESAKLIIERIKDSTNQRIITQKLFSQNKEKVFQIISTLPKENQQNLESLKIKLGLSIEIEGHQVSSYTIPKEENKNESNVKVLSSVLGLTTKKIEVGDFIKYFRNRLLEIRKILQANSSLKNLVSINKISGNRQNLSIIGIVSNKTITKNKNMIFEVEDLTGKIKVLINNNNKILYEKAEEVASDSILGFSGVGDREIIFANDIVFPDASIAERKKSPVEENVLFLGDLHFGSKLFLEENFLKFVNYLNGKVPNTPESEKIKYLFLIGDIVSGVGNYPNQERDLKIDDIEEQFLGLSNLLSKIRKDINIIISPGNHDGVRLMEPQPLLNERYAWSLYNLKNVTFTGNPSYVNIGSSENFSGFDILTYHGVSYHFYANSIPKLILGKAVKSPDKIMAYLLKNRHLAPTHASVQYFPSEEDNLIIKKVPDIFVSGHTHKSAVSYYNNILTISTSSWESKTPYQEKMGNEPDFCKVPIFNLKTRAIKMLDFEDKKEDKENDL